MRGFERFMKRQFYWVAIGIAMVAAPLAIFYPLMVLVVVGAVLAAVGVFVYYYVRELTADENDSLKKIPQVHYLGVEDVQGPLSAPVNIDDIAREAQSGPREVSAHLVEGSGMELVERFVPLGEIVFPLTFIANPVTGGFQSGSIQIAEPLCLWHRVAVTFAPTPPGAPTRYTYRCPKCPGGPKPIKNSLDELKRTIKLLVFSMLKANKMPLRSETLLEAIRRGRGETPG